MEFRILGPLQVLDGDTELRLGSPKELALLSVLLVHAGVVVSRERLIDELWGESPPPSAVKALNVHVSRLRKTLARNGNDPIATQRPGYVLGVDPDRFDAARFERLVAEAHELIAADDVPRAVAVLREALALWRGSALAGVELGGDTRSEAARLDELRLAAQMDRIDCELALGQHEQLVSELALLVAQHPLLERLRAQYMLALYRTGRQAEALGAYREAREFLVEALGLEPSQALVQLERRILNHDPSLDPPAATRQTSGEPSPRRSGRGLPRRAHLAAGTAVAVILAAAAIALIATAGHGGIRARPNAVAVIDPTTNAVARVIPIGQRPASIVAASDATWVMNRGSRTLAAIDPDTFKAGRTIHLSGFPSALALSNHTAWVTDAATGALSAIDLTTGRTVRYPLVRGDVTVQGVGRVLIQAGHLLWVSRAWPPSLLRFAVAAGRSPPVRIHPRAIQLPDIPNAAAAAPGGDLWITSGISGTVTVINPQYGNVVAHIPVGRTPVAVAAGRTSAWVANEGDETVSRIDPALFEVSATIRVPTVPSALALDPAHDALWVASGDEGTLTRIDTRSNRVSKTISVGGKPIALAMIDGRVWVTVDPR